MSSTKNDSSATKQHQKLAVFILHNESLTTRSVTVAKLKKVFSALSARSTLLNLTAFQVITSFDPSTISREKIQEVALISPEGLSEPFDRLVGSMNLRQLSNALKHHEALVKISNTSSPDTVNLVLEDDVLYNEDILDRAISTAIRTAPRDWEVMFTGLPSASDDNDDQETMKFHATNSLFRCLPSCESYLVSTKAATRLSRSFLPIRFPTNIHISWLLFDTKNHPESRTYVVSPSIFMDGSKYGTCVSTINANNRLSWNPAYIRLFSLIRATATSSTEKSASETDNQNALIDRIYESMNFKTHPDAQYLYALSLIKRQNYKKANELMTSAFKTYEKHDCNLNRSSEFLNAYCDLHKYLQDV